MKTKQSFIIVLTVTYFKNLTDLAFFNFFKYLNEQVTLKKGTWGITDGKATELDETFDAYNLLYSAITNKKTRTPQQVEDHREGRDAAQDYIEGFANEFIISNSAISNAACESLGFNRKADQRSERPVIEQTVFGEMKSMPGSRIKFTCRTQSDASRASMLDIADEVEVRYVIDTLPATWQNCPNIVTSTKAIFSIELEPETAGKMIYAYLRWKNSTDIKKSGPYGNRVSAMVSI
ncbi:MAG: hypothetical protein ABI855_10045, partial [Bacteroidota bacterium]